MCKQPKLAVMSSGNKVLQVVATQQGKEKIRKIKYVYLRSESITRKVIKYAVYNSEPLRIISFKHLCFYK